MWKIGDRRKQQSDLKKIIMFERICSTHACIS